MPLIDSLSVRSAGPLTPRNRSLWSWPSESAWSLVMAAPHSLAASRGQAPLQLADHRVVVAADQIADMPVEAALHHPHAAALDRIGDDHLRRADAGRLELAERAQDRIEVVAVDAPDLPAEAAEALVDRLDAHDVLGVAVDAQAVAVDDADQALQPEMARRHRRFPDLALVQLAVAQHAVDPVVALLHPAGKRHADRDREAVAERAGAEVDALDLLHVGMVAERAAQARVVVEQRRLEEAEVGQHRIEADRGVALAQDEAVAIGPVRARRIDPQMGVVERCEQLGRGERAGVVAGARDPGQPHRLQAHEAGAIGEELGRGVVAMPRSAAAVVTAMS